VTYLFTDVEGSTRLWEFFPTEMQAALERHDEILRSVIESSGGYVFSTAGDAFAAAFARAGDAFAAAADAQRLLHAESWPDPATLRVRMGMHTGEAQERDGDYFGSTLNRAARIMSAGHGGQILVSSVTAGLVDSYELVDLGEYRLKDLSATERLFQYGSGSFPVLRSLDAARHNLPVERTTLVGRQAEIVQLGSLVGDHRLVTLLGIGGTGKTRLATAVAGELADRFGDGVWFVDLVPVSSPEQVVEAIASSAGLQVASADLVDALATLIADRDLLFVLDNCEHITDHVADVIDELLERTSRPRFLATSREPLQLIDERQVHVAPLGVENDPASPAVALFNAAAERIGTGVGPTDFTLVARICEQLDGLPLSIELAAAQLRQLSLDELADRLDHRFELLTQRRGGRGRRQASLLGVLEDSWQMLDPHEQELLLQLAAFPASFDAQDVEALCSGLDVGIPVRNLGGLADRSLIRSAEDGHQRLLETVKLFARQQWERKSDPDVYLERHSRWVLDHLTSYPIQARYTSFELIDWANRHYEDHRAVEDRLASAGRIDDLILLLATLTDNYRVEGSQRALAAIDRIDRYLVELPLSDHDRGVLHLVCAGAGLPSRRPDRIENDSKQALEFFEVGSEPEENAVSLIIHSWMTAFKDVDKAIGLVDEATMLAEAAGAHTIADVALAYRAVHLALGRRLDEAADTLVELRARLDGSAFNYPWSMYYFIGVATQITRSPPDARASGEALHQHFHDTLDPGLIDWSAPVLVCAATAATGDVEPTRRQFALAQSAAAKGADNDGLPDLLIPLAALAWALEDVEAASRLLTAVRRSPTPTQNFLLTIVYQQIRDEVGLQDHNPLDDNTIVGIYQEAVDWLSDL
jgi:predicted ATPase/class 3 adenylate cyclase